MNFHQKVTTTSSLKFKIFLFIENLARILYSREGVQCTGARRQEGQGGSGDSVSHGASNPEPRIVCVKQLFGVPEDCGGEMRD